jgi:hypothetical protein
VLSGEEDLITEVADTYDEPFVYGRYLDVI